MYRALSFYTLGLLYIRSGVEPTLRKNNQHINKETKQTKQNSNTPPKKQQQNKQQQTKQNKEGRKEMFYLTTHSTHFILRLYGKELLSERGNPLPSHGLLFPINSKGNFMCRIAHTTAFVTPVVEHWLEQEIP